MNLLNLPTFKVTDMKQNEYGDYQISVTTISPPEMCPYCGCISNLYKWGIKKQLFMDTPMYGKKSSFIG